MAKIDGMWLGLGWLQEVRDTELTREIIVSGNGAAMPSDGSGDVDRPTPSPEINSHDDSGFKRDSDLEEWGWGSGHIWISTGRDGNTELAR
ncbi:hypothetical protein CHU98_g1545 [Xylaria longipes]|nr:hypothetical protein CHU98_g1545 [Xylaria longipes]